MLSGNRSIVIKAFVVGFLLTAVAGGADVVDAQGAAADGNAVPATAVAAAPATLGVAAPNGAYDRALGLEGAPNFRDIGGYTTADGRHVRWGEVYRSSELSKLTPADAARIESLHVATVVDLRTDEERARAQSVWTHEPANVYTSPKPSLAPVMHTILAEAGTPEGARSGLIDFYSHMPDDYRTEYAAMFHRIAAGDLPMVVHCTAGKDRTGVAVALLLTAVGVPRQTVVDDYSLTEKLVPPAAATQRAATVGGALPAASPLAQLPEESRRALWRSDPQYIGAALDSMQREYGSIDGYLERGLGLSKPEIRSLRKTLLD
jgi:protein-tyrosine phosphatase